jgi:hypothetical protein
MSAALYKFPRLLEITIDYFFILSYYFSQSMKKRIKISPYIFHSQLIKEILMSFVLILLPREAPGIYATVTRQEDGYYMKQQLSRKLLNRLRFPPPRYIYI